MTEPWVAIQRNPISGTGANRQCLIDLISGLRERGLVPRMYSNRERLTRALKPPQQRDSLVCIVAAGGDGTVGEVINRYPGMRVAVLPLGTENLLAHYLRLPCSGADLARFIAAGTFRTLDVGLLNERRFLLMASAGFDAEVIHRVHANRTGHIRKWSYIKPFWESLRKYRFPEIRLCIDGSENAKTARLVFAANLPVYARNLPVAASARGDDGLLDLRLFERGSACQMLRYLSHVTVGKHEHLADVQMARASRLRIESDRPVPVQVDGDPAGFTPADISVLPAALEIIVPPEQVDC